MSGRRPDYTVKAKSGQKDEKDKDILMSAGAAWTFTSNGGGISIVVNALPVPFDGKLVLFPTKGE